MNESELIELVRRYEAEVRLLESIQRSKDVKPLDKSYVAGKVYVYETVLHELKMHLPQVFNLNDKIK